MPFFEQVLRAIDWLKDNYNINISVYEYFELALCNRYFGNEEKRNPTKSEILECVAFYYKKDVPGYKNYMKVFILDKNAKISEVYSRVTALMYDWVNQQVVLTNDQGSFEVPFSKIKILNK